ncbi:MAG: tryptophan--tRNA ligase, partial [Bacteroidia bacterium]|nr:tryptophan--tRNA ligase [Bacteroidia bacterium]
MDIVLSGIRSTGKLHLGNYYGALRNFIRMQEENSCYFFIADIHSLTTHPDPKMLHQNVKNVLVDYLAAGIDPEKSVIYIQSDLHETAELYLYLNMHAYLGELSKTTSFKDKARKQP